MNLKKKFKYENLILALNNCTTIPTLNTLN
jgi:hypothetical protein